MKHTNGGEKREADDEGEGLARAYINTAASTAEINFSFVSLRGREASFGSSYPEAIECRSLAAKHFHRLTVRVWVLRAAAACLPQSRDQHSNFEFHSDFRSSQSKVCELQMFGCITHFSE
jgi:hypothetical protein